MAEPLAEEAEAAIADLPPGPGWGAWERFEGEHLWWGKYEGYWRPDSGGIGAKLNLRCQVGEAPAERSYDSIWVFVPYRVVNEEGPDPIEGFPSEWASVEYRFNNQDGVVVDPVWVSGEEPNSLLWWQTELSDWYPADATALYMGIDGVDGVVTLHLEFDLAGIGLVLDALDCIRGRPWGPGHPATDRLVVIEGDERVEIMPAGGPVEDRPDLATELLDRLNLLRIEEGEEPLAWSAALAEIAAGHGVEMYEEGYFSHVSPDTGSVDDRLDAQGIPFRVAGENLALNPTVDGVHGGLAASPSHRATMLEARFTRVGISVHDGPLGLMVVQVFTG